MSDDSAPSARRSRAGIVALAIIAVLLAAVAGALLGSREAPSGATGAAPAAPATPAVLADAFAAGKPVYVLFHSSTCQPCIEIDAVADAVVPEYVERVVFVDALTDTPEGAALAESFTFQYIPTSFFLTPDGQVADWYTGVLTADEMRGYLDELVAAE